MSFASAQALVADDLAAVEAKMLKKADGADVSVRSYKPLAEALRGLIRSGGKRVRPTLVLLAARFQPPARHERLISLAAAVETLHTATLVHDDVIDGAFLRRGQATLNAAWTPSSTVMAGDFFFARAAALAAETEHPRVIQLFADTLTTIVDGELRQAFAARDWGQPKQSYYDRIYGKTAALFEVAMQTAAVLGGAPETAETALHSYGYHLGMAFQIVDDILDFVGDEATLGKPAGSDLRSGIITLPVYYYLQSPARRDHLVTLVDGQRQEGAMVAEIVRLIRESDAIDQAGPKLNSSWRRPSRRWRRCLWRLTMRAWRPLPAMSSSGSFDPGPGFTPPVETTPDVSIIIVSWNVRDLLLRCLAAVPAAAGALSFETIVVDNASNDGATEAVSAAFPDVRVIANNENCGFTAANNQALVIARGDFLFLLNPDTEPRPGAIAELHRYLLVRPQVGIVGPRLWYADGSLQPSRRRFPTLATLFMESTVVQEYLPNLPLFARSTSPTARPMRPRPSTGSWARPCSYTGRSTSRSAAWTSASSCTLRSWIGANAWLKLAGRWPTTPRRRWCTTRDGRASKW